MNATPLSADLAKMLHEWRNAPSNTASALPRAVAQPEPWAAFFSGITIPSDT